MTKLDKKAVQERIERITAIFSDMVHHADKISQERCPYRDRHDHCTAKFRCRNQAADASEPSVIACLHDGKFDYRTAWESDPESFDRAKKKIAEVKQRARRGRSAKKGGKPPE